MSKAGSNGATPLPDIDSVEAALRSLPGIQSARVVADEDGGLKEVHALISQQRSPKKIVRDIESLLLVQYGYRIDYRCISLVQISDTRSSERISLVRVETIQRLSGSLIEVELTAGSQQLIGRATYNEDEAEAAVRATISALNTMFGPSTPLAVSDVQHLNFDNRKALTVCIAYHGSEIEYVIGTAFVTQQAANAAARAVLAATNRRLSGWLKNQQHKALVRTVAA